MIHQIPLKVLHIDEKNGVTMVKAEKVNPISLEDNFYKYSFRFALYGMPIMFSIGDELKLTVIYPGKIGIAYDLFEYNILGKMEVTITKTENQYIADADSYRSFKDAIDSIARC
jgi:hypothetical protein